MDERGFERFVAERYVALLRTAVLLTGDREHGQDLVQEALLRAYAASRRGAEPDSVEAYVRTVMLRLALRSRRRLWHCERPVAVVPDRAASPQDDGRGEQVRAALRTLPPGQRAVLVLRFHEGRSEAEIAATLGCSPGTVKSRTAHGLAAPSAAGLLDDEEVSHGG